MKNTFLGILLSCFIACQSFAQSNRVMNLFPEGTILHGNIPYQSDTLKKHLLDIYLPANATGKVPLIVFIHGGGWLSNDKYADMGYMKETVSEILESGYALASIDYRFSTQAVFPAQMLDCNAAISYLVDNADNYGFDTERMALMGFSAGGHLASMIGLANNNKVDEFYLPNINRSFGFKAVVDFYGPADLTLFPGAIDAKSPEGLLIGAAPLDRPDLAKMASPVSYVDENDPPFLIIHGEKDDLVSPNQSHLLNSWLKVKGVPTELIIVKDAPHFGPMFDVEEIRIKVIRFLNEELK
ncbi:alpha/beta hydrolase [Algoriphagus yeomjeoni]|uniref:Acetyl esterase/lipase n=1 Tax=Algoriphagus yeomjeoni TaxID=291403 RepID=A0A327P8B6_9BACT|nr:alpha/beta hydrolase [Algoriphagus yeomjeoni]RAI88458.1 acetyl esterase/lipase [Algoriphagus yeomjeoni]